LAIILLGLGLAGTAWAGGTEPGEDDAAVEIPPGAILVDEELYMVPAGKDEDGCLQFTAWSPTKMVTMVIQYRDRTGGFTTDKARALCD
jgi:hypothetical protein